MKTLGNRTFAKQRVSAETCRCDQHREVIVKSNREVESKAIII